MALFGYCTILGKRPHLLIYREAVLTDKSGKNGRFIIFISKNKKYIFSVHICLFQKHKNIPLYCITHIFNCEI